MTFRTVLLMLASWIATGVAQDQTPAQKIPTHDAVRILLESSIPKDQAWGAWWAAAGGMHDLEPQVRNVFEAHLDGKLREDEIVLDATLDALIQFGADSVPVNELIPLYTRRHAQTLILLAEPTRPRTEVDRFLLTIVDRKDVDGSRMDWFASADLLLSHHAPGLVASVLRHLTFTEDIEICDAGSSSRAASDAPIAVCASLPGAGSGYGGSWPSGLPDPGFLRGPDINGQIPAPTRACSSRGQHPWHTGGSSEASLRPAEIRRLQGRLNVYRTSRPPHRNCQCRISSISA